MDIKKSYSGFMGARVTARSLLLAVAAIALITAVIFLWSGRARAACISKAGTPLTVNPAAAVKKTGATVIFTFDDACESDYALAYPILKKHGIKGTSYIVTASLDHNSAGKLTWRQVEEMKAYGWVFGCHTYQHKKLTTLTDSEIREQMEKVDRDFTRHGMPRPALAAYPYGSCDARVISVIKPYRKQARLALDEVSFVDLKHVNPYEVHSVNADMWSVDRLKDLEIIVNMACEQNAVLIFRSHALYKSEPYDTGKCAIQTDSNYFEALVNYCVQKCCTFKSMADLLTLYA